MKWKNESKFAVFGLNQEKIINKLSKTIPLWNVKRIEKTKTEFFCSYFDRRHVKKFLEEANVRFELVENRGIFHQIHRSISSFGLALALIISAILWAFQAQYVVQFEVLGLDNLSKSQIVTFIQDNFSMQKQNIDVSEIEAGLLDNFDQISFASCIVKGQTLIVNIKEKLMPDEMYGEFSPIYATKSGKITSISLVSGTLNVEVGDFVREGDILVFPYVLDSAGELKKVEASAQILADVYNVGTAEHYETKITLERTGNVSVDCKITLFGLTIYTFSDGLSFDLFETEEETVNMTNNLFLPFKIFKTTKYELVENKIESTFEQVQDQVIEEARMNAIACLQTQNIVEEYYAIRHISSLSIVTYTIVTNEQI